MTQNTLQMGPQIIWVVAGAVILFLFALTLGLPHRPDTQPGSKGHREREAEGGHEEIRPDGYIDSFANEIEEAGGGMPPVLKLALPGILIWWLVYLILFWTKR